PAGGLGLQAQARKHIVHHPIFGVEKPGKDQPGKGQGQGPGQEQRQAHGPLALERQIGQHGQAQAHDQGPGHGDQGDQQGVLGGVPEQGVLHHVHVVGQAQKQAGLVHIEQAVVDQFADGVDDDQKQQQKSGGQQHHGQRFFGRIAEFGQHGQVHKAHRKPRAQLGPGVRQGSDRVQADISASAHQTFQPMPMIHRA
ncbi:Uncharacterized protein APZ42_002548, partial [Daphnia magna]